jgi:hypothetical protein
MKHLKESVTKFAVLSFLLPRIETAAVLSRKIKSPRKEVIRMTTEFDDFFCKLTGFPVESLFRFAEQYSHIWLVERVHDGGRWVPHLDIEAIGTLLSVRRKVDEGLTEEEAWQAVSEQRKQEMRDYPEGIPDKPRSS